MDLNELHKLAELSKLAYTDEELVELSASFESLKSFVDTVKNADVDGERKIDTINMSELREDIAEDSMDTDTLLMNAPQSSKGCYVVPRIVE